MRARVTRLRQLTPGQLQRIDALRRISTLLDSAFVVPGTDYRVGLPRIVQVRMIFNVGLTLVLMLVAATPFLLLGWLIRRL